MIAEHDTAWRSHAAAVRVRLGIRPGIDPTHRHRPSEWRTARLHPRAQSADTPRCHAARYAFPGARSRRPCRRLRLGPRVARPFGSYGIHPGRGEEGANAGVHRGEGGVVGATAQVVQPEGHDVEERASPSWRSRSRAVAGGGQRCPRRPGPRDRAVWLYARGRPDARRAPG